MREHLQLLHLRELLSFFTSVKTGTQFLDIERRCFETLNAASQFSDMAPSGCLISCAIAAVASSTLITRWARSRRCKVIALASRA